MHSHRDYRTLTSFLPKTNERVNRNHVWSWPQLVPYHLLISGRADGLYVQTVRLQHCALHGKTFLYLLQTCAIHAYRLGLAIRKQMVNLPNMMSAEISQHRPVPFLKWLAISYNCRKSTFHLFQKISYTVRGL